MCRSPFCVSLHFCDHTLPLSLSYHLCAPTKGYQTLNAHAHALNLSLSLSNVHTRTHTQCVKERVIEREETLSFHFSRKTLMLCSDVEDKTFSPFFEENFQKSHLISSSSQIKLGQKSEAKLSRSHFFKLSLKIKVNQKQLLGKSEVSDIFYSKFLYFIS